MSRLIPLLPPRQDGFVIRTKTDEIGRATHVNSRTVLRSPTASWLHCIRDIELTPEGAVAWGATQRLVDLFQGTFDKDGQRLELLQWSQRPELSPEGALRGFFVLYAYEAGGDPADIPLIASSAEFMRTCQNSLEHWQ